MEAELAKILKDMYRGSRHGGTVSMAILFGIRYASDLELKDVSLAKVVKLSGIPMSYCHEVRKGVKLSKFVQEK